MLLKRQVLILGIVLFAINIVAFLPFDLDLHRITRILTTSLVFVFFIFKIRHYSFWIYLILIFQICSSIGFHYYDITYGAMLFIIASLLSYLIITLRVAFKIEWKKIKLFEYMIYLVLFVSNIAFHYSNVTNFGEQIPSDLIKYLVYALGFSGMTMCLIVAFFNATNTNTRSSYYIYATFGFVFADFCAMMAYYYEFFPVRFYFIERSCYGVALCMFLAYAYFDDKSFKKKTNGITAPSQDSVFL